MGHAVFLIGGRRELGKVIVRLKGGLGNQLFCYATARRLALVTGGELVLDDYTGFVRDKEYARRYSLEKFNIAGRAAKPSERFWPFERFRRAVSKRHSIRKPLSERFYIEQNGFGFDEEILQLRPTGDVYLDGLWQSVRHFSDVAEVIRRDLSISKPNDACNLEAATKIRCSQAVAIHVRWFDPPDGVNGTRNVSMHYYRKAISVMEERVEEPSYFLFSDNPAAALARLDLPRERTVLVDHNRTYDDSYADLWLMQQCQHFIIPRSTFGWWGAWLAKNQSKIVLVPTFTPPGAMEWRAEGLIFEGCEQL